VTFSIGELIRCRDGSGTCGLVRGGQLYEVLGFSKVLISSEPELILSAPEIDPIRAVAGGSWLANRFEATGFRRVSGSPVPTYTCRPDDDISIGYITPDMYLGVLFKTGEGMWRPWGDQDGHVYASLADALAVARRLIEPTPEPDVTLWDHLAQD